MSETLQEAITSYGRGLRAELAILEQVGSLSAAQQEATDGGDVKQLARIAAERERLTQALVTLEAQIRPVRACLADGLTLARQLPGFDDLVTLHREAERLVASILADDRVTLRALQQAEHARRLAAQAIEVGEATLAAYRRVLTPSPGSAGIIDRRG